MNTTTSRRCGARNASACLFPLLGLLPVLAGATTFNVTTTADSGAGSLRDAIDEANRTIGNDTITFGAGVSGTIVLTSGAIDIIDSLRITGPGAARLSVSGNSGSRIFRMEPPNPDDIITVTVTGLSLINATTSEEGGAVFVGNSDLTVSDCIFRNNSAQRGGGLYAFPNGSTTLTVRNTRFENNSATADGGGFGAQDIDAVVVENVVATGNTAVRSGGGAYVRGVAFSMTQSNFSNNTSSTLSPSLIGITGGAGLRIEGSKATATASISTSRLVGNASQNGQGGALWISALPPSEPPVVATTTLDRLQISSNTANLAGGGVFTGQVNATLSNSSLAGNTAQQTGGGIAFQSAGALSVSNTTLAGNTSALAAGGGIHSASATTLSVTSSTIVGNTATSGGGIAREGAAATLRNSIVANNNAPSAQDLSGAFAPNYTLIKNTAGATLSAGSGNPAAGTDPMLGAPTINGGPTVSLLPASGSPVLNAGDPAGTGLPTTDQRGLPRVTGGRVDLGAIERQSPEDVIFRNGF